MTKNRESRRKDTGWDLGQKEKKEKADLDESPKTVKRVIHRRKKKRKSREPGNGVNKG